MRVRSQVTAVERDGDGVRLTVVDDRDKTEVVNTKKTFRLFIITKDADILTEAHLSEAMGDLNWEVIFVDDDSPDGTSTEARRLGQENGRVRCLQRIDRRGLSSACIEGMLASSAQVSICWSNGCIGWRTSISRISPRKLCRRCR